MELQQEKIHSAIKGGDLKYLKEVLSEISDEERLKFLKSRFPDNIVIVRPSSENEVLIKDPTPLVVSVAEWYPEIVDFLASFGIGLDEECTVDDPINYPSVYNGVTSLHIATMAGKIQMVKSLVNYGASINKQTSLGDTPVFESCFEGHQNVVKYLVEKGAKLEISNQKQITCLMIAAYADNAEVIKYIVEAGIDLNVVDKEGRNALFYTVAGGRIDTLAYLLDNGIEIKTDTHKVNILMEAVHHGNKEMVRYLTQYHKLVGIDLKGIDDVGRNVLYYTMDNPDTDNLELLLLNGVPLDPMPDGRTLLMSATLKKNIAIVKYLTEYANKIGVNINEKDQKGRNCLFYCITGGDIDLFEYLVSQGVLIEPSSDSVTLLMQAVAKYRMDFTCYLLEQAEQHGLDINAQDADGWNAAFYAVASGYTELFEVLVMHGAVCHQTNDGRTILMQAAAKGNLELLRLIMDNAKDFRVYVNQRDNDGWNCLFYTIQGGHMNAFKFLLKKGAKVCVALNGSTLLMEAVDKNQLEFVQYLLSVADTLGIDINYKDKSGNNVLFYAVANGHIHIFQTLLNAGVTVESDDHNRTLLMQAALHGHMELVQHLVNFSDILNIDLKQKDKDGRNVLFYCVEGDHLEVLKYLNTAGIEAEKDKNRRTNLMQSCRAGYMDLVKYFTDNAESCGLSLNDKDENGENALFYAARSRHLSVIHYLLDKGIEICCNKFGINIFAQSLYEHNDDIVQAIMQLRQDKESAVIGRDTRGKTVLHHYVIRGNIKILQELAQYYNPDLDSDAEGVTLLMYACTKKSKTHTEIMKFLVEELKVDINKRDKKGQSALFHAALSSNCNAVTYLLDQPTISISYDNEGRSPLIIASSGSISAIVEALLESKKGHELAVARDNYGRTAIHYSAMHGKDHALSLLKTYGCDINAKDDEGITAVMYAVRGGHYRTVSALLKRAASLEICDNQYRSALHHSFLKPIPEPKCAKFLIKFGVDINQKDKTGVTALMLACQACAKSDISLIKFLLECGADPILQDKEGKDSFDYCAFDAEYVKALMREKAELATEQKEALERNKEYLMESVDLQSVLRGLMKQEILTKTLNFEVNKRPASERVAKLLDILCYRGTNAFSSLCRVLKQSGQAELSYFLMKESYKKDEEIYW